MANLTSEMLQRLNGADCLSQEALETAAWMRSNQMGVYSPDLDSAVANELAAKAASRQRVRRTKGVAAGEVYAAARAVEIAMNGGEPAYGGSK